MSFADATTGDVDTWQWDFGDGQTSTLQNPSHEYTSAGQYTVILTATGPAGSDTATKTGYIDVSPAPVAPVADFTGTPTSGTAPLSVSFADATTGDVDTWQWDFGDGTTSTLQNPSHEYTSAGLYTVSLTATGATGGDTATKTGYIDVSPPPVAPVAEFTGTPTSGAAPLSVAFTDATTGDVDTWLWDFGDGATSTLQNPTHEYASVGTYTVNLTATGPAGEDSEAKPDYVEVLPAPPVSDFSGTPTSGATPLTVAFTDATTGDVDTWQWDFGDGTTSTLQNPSHEYTSAGQYTVSLTATGAAGEDTATKAGYITVSEAEAFDSILDNDSAAFVGIWSTSTFVPGYYGSNYAWTEGGGDGSTTAEWLFDLPSDGLYKVLAWWSAPYSTRSPDAPYTIHHAAGSTTVDVDQNANGSQWNDLGTYEFTAGPARVTLSNDAQANPVADAVRVVYVGAGGTVIAGFSASPLSGMEPLTVSFVDQSAGPVDSWQWDFGDGNTSGEQSPSHTYLDPGLYTVTLTVTERGSDEHRDEDGSRDGDQRGWCRRHVRVARRRLLHLPVVRQ